MAVSPKKKKGKTDCFNCPVGRKKKKNFLKLPPAPKDARILVICPRSKIYKQWVSSWFKKHSIDNYYIMHDVMCKGAIENEKDYNTRVMHCHSVMKKLLDDGEFTQVIALGLTSYRMYMAERYEKKYCYERVRGYTFPDKQNNVWVSVVTKPTKDSITGNGNTYKDVEKLELVLLRKDMTACMKYTDLPLPDWTNHIRDYCIVVDELGALKILAKIVEDREFTDYVAFDFETTGLKPYAEGHRIVSLSIAPSDTCSYSFLMYDSLKPLIRRFLTNRNIPKIAANNGFEYKWAKQDLGVNVNGLVFDVVLAQHLLDNRKAICSIKFQAFRRYGIFEYDKHMSKYLVPEDVETENYGDNAINNIHNAPRGSLLFYGAMDSLITYRLGRDMMKELHYEY